MKRNELTLILWYLLLMLIAFGFLHLKMVKVVTEKECFLIVGSIGFLMLVLKVKLLK